jgi:IS30 family transposase
MQHTTNCVSARSVAHETTTSNLLHGYSEGFNVGALEKGDSLQQIAQLFDRHHSAVQRILAESGGIRPPERTRSKLALTLAEREAISRGLASGQSMRLIATELGRSPSTISREIGRNGDPESYRANQSDQAAWDRAHRPQTCKLVLNKTLAHLVADKLQHYWSPQQIVGWLKETYPDQEDYQVSHETIYLSLFIQARGALKKELTQHLRRTRIMRRSRHHTLKDIGLGKLRMQSRSESGQPRQKIELFMVTGKAIFCMGMPIARSPLS